MVKFYQFEKKFEKNLAQSILCLFVSRNLVNLANCIYIACFYVSFKD